MLTWGEFANAEPELAAFGAGRMCRCLLLGAGRLANGLESAQPTERRSLAAWTQRKQRGNKRGVMSDIARAALRHGVLFQEIEDDALDGILQVGREASFGAGEPIFEAGDAPNGMYVVLEGEAQVDVGGRFHRLKAGDFFGEMGLLTSDRRMATVRAVEPVRALQIETDAFQQYLLEHPQVAVSMLRAVVHRLREVEQRIDAWMGSTG